MTKQSLEQQAQTLANYLPGGRVFGAKNIGTSNLRDLLRGLAGEMIRIDEALYAFRDDINPSTTLYFLDEWEAALGIPDSCFSGSGTIDARRADVLLKLAALGVQTAGDFVALGTLLGLTVTVEPAAPYALFPMTFPILLLDSEKEARFTIVVGYGIESASVFPLTFPFVFGSAGLARLQCLFDKLKPANCNLIFRQV